MQVLHLLSGLPPLFLDLRHFDITHGLFGTLCNCGGQSIYYSRRSAHPAENLKAVAPVPVIPKYGGMGCHVRYVGCAGPLTFAPLTHDAAGPELLVFRGKAVVADDSWLAASCPNWPHLFVTTTFGPDELFNALHANHVHAGAGDWVEAVETVGRMVEVRVTRL